MCVWRTVPWPYAEQIVEERDQEDVKGWGGKERVNLRDILRKTGW